MLFIRKIDLSVVYRIAEIQTPTDLNGSILVFVRIQLYFFLSREIACHETD